MTRTLLFNPAVPPADGPANVQPTVIRDIHTQYSRFAMEQLLPKPGGPGGTMLLKAAPAADSAERMHEKLAILLRVSQLLSSPEKIEALLAKILELVFQILDVDRAAILMVDPQTNELLPRVVKAAPGRDASGQFYSSQIVSYVRDKSVAALFSDAKLDPRLGTAASVFAQSICASMCAPLKPRDVVVGVLYVDNLSIANRFTEEDLEFLTAFANQAAIAIENATLYRRIEQEAVQRNMFLRFFPPATIKKLEESQTPGALLDVIETEVTALFADISNFTAMSSLMQPREVVDLLNEYFPVMAEIVFRHEGTLEKYIGDALMAVWGAPFKHPDDVDRALHAAVEMHQALAGLNARWRARGKHEIQIHVGLNTGRVAAGNIGSERYLQYATIGDATNVASRVCNVASSGEIVISDATFARLRKSNWTAERLAPVMVKGKDEPIVCHRIRWQ